MTDQWRRRESEEYAADDTRVVTFRVPCRCCRRGNISVFEVGASPRGRRVACPVCGGRGFTLYTGHALHP